MIKTHLIEIFLLSCYQIGVKRLYWWVLRLKIYKFRVWIYSHIDNKNTQRPFKTNIKELTQIAVIFKALLRGFNGVKGGVFKISLSALKNNHKIKINYQKA
ncbi:hypothetical protein HpBT0258_06080 [Helicobacter pylori]